jgi:hypothetical protein
MSIGDLWPEINSSHEVDDEGAFVTATWSQLEALMSHPLSGVRGLKKRKVKEGKRDATKGFALGSAPGPSSAQPRGFGGGSGKSKATRIWTDASGDISPCMKSFLLKGDTRLRSEWTRANGR